MSQYHSLRVKNIIPETSDACSIEFDIPQNLASEFKYVQGQYLSFKKEIDGEEIVRAYSLSSAPFEASPKVTVKRIEGGKFSTFATKELAIGDNLLVFPPKGNFYTELNANNKKSYVAFTAGSGITPIMSILKSTLEIEKESVFTLFYGNKTNDSIIFKSELESLKQEFGDRLNVHFLLTREEAGAELLNGRLSGEKCEALSKSLFSINEVDEYFLCGPQSMIESISDYLKQQNVDKSKLHFELFFVESNDNDQADNIPSADFDVAKITLVIDGDELGFDSAAGKMILDAAIKEELDVPFSCKSGVCCTCRAKVISGEVKMLNNYALEEEEVEDGFVLTCQSIPLTSEVILDMDE